MSAIASLARRPAVRGPAVALVGILAASVALAPRPGWGWDDLRPISEPAAAPPAAPAPRVLFNETFFLTLGFSFMVGLAVGYALKVAFKLALIVIGIVLIGIFALQYEGLVHVDWSGLEARYDTWAGWLSVNGGALLDFMGRNLANAASFAAGLLLGLKL
jgi:uncharacterized membrane protein (Fun14 family)